MHYQTSKASTASAPARLPAAAELPAIENDRAFIRMLDAYRSSGGMARATEVFTLFKSRSQLGVASLAHWMAQRSVVSLEWHADVWLPLFQFDRRHMTIKPALGPVFTVLNPLLSPWELTQWCAQPHRWLNGESPADTLDVDPSKVLRAACADRLALL